jgi:hypothetical protein
MATATRPSTITPILALAFYAIACGSTTDPAQDPIAVPQQRTASPASATSARPPAALSTATTAASAMPGPRRTHDEVEQAFLTPASAGMPLGLTTDGARGQTTTIPACLPPEEGRTAQVTVSKRYAVAWRVITTQTHRLSQVGWVFPTTAAAESVMTRLKQQAGSCRYSVTHVQPMDGIGVTQTSTSRPYTYRGWNGWRTEVSTTTGNLLLTVTSQLLAQRGNLILWLTVKDGTFDPSAAHRSAQNFPRLTRVLRRLG